MIQSIQRILEFEIFKIEVHAVVAFAGLVVQFELQGIPAHRLP
jgi:hypothetical protein